MSRHSLLFKITLLFLVALGTLAMFFILLSGVERHRQHMEVEHRAMVALRILHRFDEEVMIDERLELLGFVRGSAPSKEASLVMERPLHRGRLRLWEEDGRCYVELQRHHGVIYLKEISQRRSATLSYWLTFAASSLILGALFWSIYVRLAPLAQLTDALRRFGEGESEVELSVRGDDEIASLAKAFNAMVQKTRELSQARTLMLRTIAHELKTPITKGRLALEFLPRESPTEILLRVFNRLELIVGEILAVEKITASQTLQKGSYRLSDLVDHALDLLIDKEDHIDVEIPPVMVVVDFTAFSLALKNLLDNALKHGEDGRAVVRLRARMLEIVNRGCELTDTLDSLTQPFVKSQESKGLGLGLYIVSRILVAHGLTLNYRHEAGENIFCIDLTPVVSGHE